MSFFASHSSFHPPFSLFPPGKLALTCITLAVGRPHAYAFTRENSVEHVIKTILVDLEVSLSLGGFRNLGEIQGRMREVLVPIGGGMSALFYLVFTTTDWQ